MTNDSGGVATGHLQTAGLLTKVVRGTAVSLFAGSAVAITSFIVTPFTIRLFGPEQYGIWAIVMTIVSYFGLADLGMTTASTRFASDAYTRGDSQQEISVVWTATFLGLIPGALFAGALWLFAEEIARQLIHAPPQLNAQVVLAIRMTGLIFIGYILSGIWNTAELVRLRMGLFNGINTFGSVLQIALVPVVLKLGGGLSGAAITVACVTIVTGLVHFFVSGRLMPGFWSTKVRISQVRPLLSFGIPLVFSFFAEMALVGSDKLVLARVTGPQEVAHYAVAASFAALLAVIPQALNRAIFTAYARLLAVREVEPLNSFYERTVRGNVIWLIPSLISCWMICRPFLAWWAGPEYGETSTIPAYVLLVGWAVDAISLLPTRLLVAAGKTRTVAGLYAIQALPFLACAVFMGQRYGAVGVAWTWTLRAFVNAILLFSKASAIARLRESPMAGRHLLFILALGPLIILLFFAASQSYGLTVRLVSIAAGLSFYFWVVWKKILRVEERDWLQATITSPPAGN